MNGAYAPPFPCGSNRAGAKCALRAGKIARREARGPGGRKRAGASGARGQNCSQGGARAGRTASGRERPARGQNCAQGGARAGRTASGRERPARAGKIARREARGPGGRQADGSVRRARAKGPTLRHILFPASPHPLRGKARCGIVYSPETRHAATYAGCAPCRAADQRCDAPVPLPLRRAPAARHVGFSPSASCRCPHAQAQAFPCAAAKAPHSRALTPPHGQNRTGACHTKFTR